LSSGDNEPFITGYDILMRMGNRVVEESAES